MKLKGLFVNAESDNPEMKEFVKIANKFIHEYCDFIVRGKFRGEEDEKIMSSYEQVIIMMIFMRVRRELREKIAMRILKSLDELHTEFTEENKRELQALSDRTGETLDAMSSYMQLFSLMNLVRGK